MPPKFGNTLETKSPREKRTLFLTTGYALSETGMWRQHSWLVDISETETRIIETTVSRVAYFGFVMTEQESEEFIQY